MEYLLAESHVGIETVLSVTSLVVTLYFWFVQANRERPDLRFFQLTDMRAVTRRVHGREGTLRLCVQQLDSHGVLVANNSSRQNSIVNYECSFQHQGQTIVGDWGYVDDDMPPWNIGPDSSIGLGLALFFDVADDFDIPDQLEFRVTFFTVNGRRFDSRFWLKAPSVSLQRTNGSHFQSAKAA